MSHGFLGLSHWDQATATSTERCSSGCALGSGRRSRSFSYGRCVDSVDLETPLVLPACVLVLLCLGLRSWNSYLLPSHPSGGVARRFCGVLSEICERLSVGLESVMYRQARRSVRYAELMRRRPN